MFEIYYSLINREEDMKKLYTKTALVLASATLLVFSVGCTNEELVSEPVANYEEHFKETFGDVDPTHDWSMATPVTASIDLSNAPEGTYEVKIYSEKTSELIDSEIEALNKEAGMRAEAVLKANRKYLDELAVALLEKETLEEAEVAKILEGTILPEIAKLHN